MKKRRIESTDAHRCTQMIRKKMELFFFPLGIRPKEKGISLRRANENSFAVSRRLILLCWQALILANRKRNNRCQSVDNNLLSFFFKVSTKDYQFLCLLTASPIHVLFFPLPNAL
jgi:hypothetical protein